MEKREDYIGSLFEEDYLIRTLGPIAHDPYVALTELVANAWDAGAKKVDLAIPEKIGGSIFIRDDGVGLTRDEFLNRWMKLGYNRLKHQGEKVRFPDEVDGTRLAYGRNGVGRHGLLCFNDEYTVETSSGGEKSTFVITTHNETEPFIIQSQNYERDSYHGTLLQVEVRRNLPSLEKARIVIASRFLHDPEFRVVVNTVTLPLEELEGHIDSRQIQVGAIDYRFHFIDTTKANRSTIYQGIAFWQAGRLVGEPSWTIGNVSLIDGRTRYAKQYTAVIETDGLGPYVKDDWSGFISSPVITDLYEKVCEYVQEIFGRVAEGTIKETLLLVHQEFTSQIADLSQLGKYEVDEAVSTISRNHPTSRPEVYSIAVETVINLERTRNGKSLLKKLAGLSEEDIAGLDRLLSEWTIKDALCVLDEIDKRLTVVEAIRKLSSDREIDELKILHPLVTEARWLFGPEFDSPEYVSNRQLGTVVQEIFGTQIDKSIFLNSKKRPDLVLLADSSISCTGTDAYNTESDLYEMKHILLIELKRGGFTVSRKERDQAHGYVDDFIGCGSLIGSPFIDAFVVGEHIDGKATNMEVRDGDIPRGRLRMTTYGQLVDTAERRLFNLRKKLNDRYDDLPCMDLLEKDALPQELPFLSN